MCRGWEVLDRGAGVDELTYVFHQFDPDTGRGDEVLRIEDQPPFTNWDVSRDGTTLVVGHNNDRLRVIDLATGDERVLSHDGLSYGEFPSFSADGRGIFVDGGYATRGRCRKDFCRSRWTTARPRCCASTGASGTSPRA